MDARVVELDPLADPVGSGAQDDDRLALAGQHLGLLLVRRVVVRGAGLELTGARIDRLVDRAHGQGVAHAADDRLVQGAQHGDLVIGESGLLASTRSSWVSASAPATSSATSWSWRIWSRYHGSIQLAANTSSMDIPEARARRTEWMRSAVGWASFAVRSSRTCASDRSTRDEKSNSASDCSSDRMALSSACPKVRPSAMTSPTLFMVVVRVGSAAGNFSNAKRGIFTTT